MVMILEDKGIGTRVKEFFAKPRNTISAAAFALLAISIPVTAVLISQQQSMQQSAAESANADSQYYTKIMDMTKYTANNIMSYDPIKLYPQEYSQLGLSCIAEFRAYEAVKGDDPVQAQKFRDYGVKVADYIYTTRDLNNNGKAGWGYAQELDPFGNGKKVPPNTEDAYFTGLASQCLMDAYKSTGDLKYLNTARDAINNFMVSSTTVVDPSCTNCRYFWPYTYQNQNDRKIKNRNMILGMGLSNLERSGADRNLRGITNQIYNSERYEIDFRKFFGYSSYNDPQAFYFNFPENHMWVEMWGFEELARNSGRPQAEYAPTLASLWNAYVTCKGHEADLDYCKAVKLDPDKGVWRAMMSCQLARYGEPYLSECKESVSYYSTMPGKVPHLTVIGMLNALSLFPKPTNSTPTFTLPTATPTLSSPTATPTPVVYVTPTKILTPTPTISLSTPTPTVPSQLIQICNRTGCYYVTPTPVLPTSTTTR